MPPSRGMRRCCRRACLAAARGNPRAHTKTARTYPLAAAVRGNPRAHTKAARTYPLAARAGGRALVRDAFATNYSACRWA